MPDRRLRRGIVLASGTGRARVIATGIGAPWRTILALWFVLVCPGVSLVGVLGLRDRLVELGVVAPLSLTLVTLTSVALFYGGVWSTDADFGLLLVRCLIGLTWPHLRS